MYCRKCGAKLSDTAKFCDSCGEEVKVIKQRSDSQKYEERQKNDQSKESKKKIKQDQKIDELKNPYVIPALGTAILAFGLAIFPWPISWGIGTSLWMRIAILLIALLSDYHCTKSRQVNNLYHIQYRYRVQPQLVKTATILATLTTVVALFALINM
ncbi:zinc-ribbon domain-containing protein [Candidatus Stoquefichus sp. SB1]|uniref:zinc-ribbon domain-containing protein n=1 Tax=Candidatus Stoquefichus sp. SB1 TaxID=1658109 RepID=UPI00067E92C5|nr:zinc-ribbon domain-containing protein [Candidatus Stoquefichus sp. SB1]